MDNHFTVHSEQCTTITVTFYGSVALTAAIMKNSESQWEFGRNISPPSSELKSKPRKKNKIKQAALLFDPEDEGGTLLRNRYDRKLIKSDKTLLSIVLYRGKTYSFFFVEHYKLQLNERFPGKGFSQNYEVTRAV